MKTNRQVEGDAFWEVKLGQAGPWGVVLNRDHGVQVHISLKATTHAVKVVKKAHAMLDLSG